MLFRSGVIWGHHLGLFGVVWGLCFGKVGGVISFLFGPVRGCHRMGPQCLLTPPAAVVYVSGDSGQFVISGVLLLSYSVSCVNLSVLSIILSFFLSLGGPEP